MLDCCHGSFGRSILNLNVINLVPELHKWLFYSYILGQGKKYLERDRQCILAQRLPQRLIAKDCSTLNCHQKQPRFNKIKNFFLILYLACNLYNQTNIQYTKSIAYANFSNPNKPNLWSDFYFQSKTDGTYVIHF